MTNKHRQIVSAIAIGAAVLVVWSIALTGTASAARPQKVVVSFDDPVYEAELGAFLSDVCGFPITVDATGKVSIKIFDHGRHIQIDNYSERALFTNPASGATLRLVDAGPDLVSVDRATGHLIVAVTGHSSTGTGVYGRVVIDLDTGEILSVSGNDTGDFLEGICNALS